MGAGVATTDLQDRLKQFLERLGRSVEIQRPGRLVARHRTALLEEETDFNIIGTSTDRALKRSINIFARHLELPDSGEFPNCFHLDEFLDRTVQADRIADGIFGDSDVNAQREHFVPQHVAIEGDGAIVDSIEYLFDEWLPNEDNRLLSILAPAGYGKTVLTCELAHRLASNYLAAEPGRRPPLPFLVPFGRYRRIASFEGMVLSSLQDKGITDYTAGAFAQLVQQGRIVLILDGFDELLEERPEEARKNLRELIETLDGRGKVIVTARSTFFRTSDDVAGFLEYYLDRDRVSVVEIQPFDKAQRREFVTKRIRDVELSAKALDAIEGDNVVEAMGSPLLLRETVNAFKFADESDGGTIELDESRLQLFRTLEKSVYARERERHNHSFSDVQQRAFLTSLANEMLSANCRGFDWESVRVAALEAVAEDDLPESELNLLADHHFLTVIADSEEVQFNHQVFREYFQADSVVAKSEAGEVAWVRAMLSQRPIPEEVRSFLAELDPDAKLLRAILEDKASVRGGSERFINNLGAVCSSYRNLEQFNRFIEIAPKEAFLNLQVDRLDLSQTDWSGRFLQEVRFENCKLSGASFSDAYVAELWLVNTDVKGADFAGSSIDALNLGGGQWFHGRSDVLFQLQRIGAKTGLEEASVVQDLRIQRREEVIEILRSRLNRFYLAGDSDGSDSRWDTSIQERNFLGGVKPSERRFVKSQLIPAMRSEGVVEQSRAYGLVIYNLVHGAEDDARALMESDELRGRVASVVERVLAKSS